MILHDNYGAAPPPPRAPRSAGRQIHGRRPFVLTGHARACWIGSSFRGIDEPLHLFNWSQFLTEKWFPLFLELL
jgi:hypothetical protein